MEKANNFHSTIKFTAEMSKTEISFLDTKVYKRVTSDSTLNLSWGAFDREIWINPDFGSAIKREIRKRISTPRHLFLDFHFYRSIGKS